MRLSTTTAIFRSSWDYNDSGGPASGSVWTVRRQELGGPGRASVAAAAAGSAAESAGSAPEAEDGLPPEDIKVHQDRWAQRCHKHYTEERSTGNLHQLQKATGKVPMLTTLEPLVAFVEFDFSGSRRNKRKTSKTFKPSDVVPWAIDTAAVLADLEEMFGHVGMDKSSRASRKKVTIKIEAETARWFDHIVVQPVILGMQAAGLDVSDCVNPTDKKIYVDYKVFCDGKVLLDGEFKGVAVLVKMKGDLVDDIKALKEKSLGWSCVVQLHAYMVKSGAKYGFLSTLERTWFCKLEGGVLHVSHAFKLKDKLKEATNLNQHQMLAWCLQDAVKDYLSSEQQAPSAADAVKQVGRNGEVPTGTIRSSYLKSFLVYRDGSFEAGQHGKPRPRAASSASAAPLEEAARAATTEEAMGGTPCPADEQSSSSSTPAVTEASSVSLPCAMWEAIVPELLAFEKPALQACCQALGVPFLKDSKAQLVKRIEEFVLAGRRLGSSGGVDTQSSFSAKPLENVALAGTSEDAAGQAPCPDAQQSCSSSTPALATSEDPSVTMPRSAWAKLVSGLLACTKAGLQKCCRALGVRFGKDGKRELLQKMNASVLAGCRLASAGGSVDAAQDVMAARKVTKHTGTAPGGKIRRLAAAGKLHAAPAHAVVSHARLPLGGAFTFGMPLRRTVSRHAPLFQRRGFLRSGVRVPCLLRVHRLCAVKVLG